MSSTSSDVATTAPAPADDRYPMPAVDEIRLAEVLKAVADPGRLRVVEVLADGLAHPTNPDEYGLDVHKSTMSHHVKILREAGLTSTHPDGRVCYLRLRREALDERFPGLVDALTSAKAVSDLRRDA